MKDEDGELHNVMLFAGEGDLNCYPIDWYANSIYTDKDDTNILIGWIIENNDFTADQPQGWTACNRCRGDWIASCADGSAKQCKASKTLSVMPLSELQLLRNVNAHEQVASALVKGSSQVLNSTSVGDEVMIIVYDDAEKKVIIDSSKRATATWAVFADKDVEPISESILGLLLPASGAATFENVHVWTEPTNVWPDNTF
ncbi:hypothetical protein PR002_g27395 [Phytophthora rubi]|uniref:Glycosyl hydrolase family 32 C-terminal domain-containing protein n=1 Tax=Phytophthora rubi TaxID=129364 RepID=A0A6A3HMM2_9STRA|nr:hypothetical protein PR002_g27395 [Phytophthora rubi]